MSKAETENQPATTEPKPRRRVRRGGIGFMGMPNSGKTEFVTTARDRAAPTPEECPGWEITVLGAKEQHDFQAPEHVRQTMSNFTLAPLFQARRRGSLFAYAVDAPDGRGEHTRLIATGAKPRLAQADDLRRYRKYLTGCVGIVCAIDPFGYSEEDQTGNPDQAIDRASHSVRAIANLHARRGRLFGLLPARHFPIAVMLTKIDAPPESSRDVINLPAARSLVAQYLDVKGESPAWMNRPDGFSAEFLVSKAIQHRPGDLEYAERLAWDFLNAQAPQIAEAIHTLNRDLPMNARPYLMSSYGRQPDTDVTGAVIRPGMSTRKPRRQMDAFMSVLERDHHYRRRRLPTLALGVIFALAVLVGLFGPYFPSVVGWSAQQFISRGQLGAANAILKVSDSYPAFPWLKANMPGRLRPLADANRALAEGQLVRAGNDGDRQDEAGRSADRAVFWSPTPEKYAEWRDKILVDQLARSDPDQQFQFFRNGIGALTPSVPMLTAIDRVMAEWIRRARAPLEECFRDGPAAPDPDQRRRVATAAGLRLAEAEKLADCLVHGTAFFVNAKPELPPEPIGLAHLSAVRAGQGLVKVVEKSLESVSRPEAAAAGLDTLATAIRIAEQSGRPDVIADAAAALDMVGRWQMPALDPKATVAMLRKELSRVQVDMADLGNAALAVPSVVPAARAKIEDLRGELRFEAKRQEEGSAETFLADAEWRNVAAAIESCAKLLGEDDREGPLVLELSTILRLQRTLTQPDNKPAEDEVRALERTSSGAAATASDVVVGLPSGAPPWNLTHSLRDHRRDLAAAVITRLAEAVRKRAPLGETKPLTRILTALHGARAGLPELVVATEAVVRGTSGPDIPDLRPLCAADLPQTDEVTNVLNAIADPASPRALSNSIQAYKTLRAQIIGAPSTQVASRLLPLANRIFASILAQWSTARGSDLAEVVSLVMQDSSSAGSVEQMLGRAIAPDASPELANRCDELAARLKEWGKQPAVAALLKQQAGVMLANVMRNGDPGEPAWRDRLLKVAAQGPDREFASAYASLTEHLRQMAQLDMVLVTPGSVRPFWIGRTELTSGRARTQPEHSSIRDVVVRHPSKPSPGDVLRYGLSDQRAREEAASARVRLPHLDEWTALWKLAAPVESTPEVERAMTPDLLDKAKDRTAAPPNRVIIGLRWGLSEWVVDSRGSPLLVGGSYMSSAAGDGRPGRPPDLSSAGVRFAADAVPRAFSDYAGAAVPGK